jgi:hypothetical protein
VIPSRNQIFMKHIIGIIALNNNACISSAMMSIACDHLL